jgi:hypothetical protein
MWTVVDRNTGWVETVAAAVIAPAGTVTLSGTVATEVFELASATTAPPGGAGLLSLTVAVDGEPPLTVLGVRVIADKTAALTVSRAVRVNPPYAAEMVTAVVGLTG